MKKTNLNDELKDVSTKTILSLKIKEFKANAMISLMFLGTVIIVIAIFSIVYAIMEA